MTNRQTLYAGVTRAAWGYFFLYFDINLGTVSILPSFVGWLLFLSSIELLKEELRDLILLRPLGILLVIWHGTNWLLSWFGISLDNHLAFLGLIVNLASLYFHFQILTDFATLAIRYQQSGDAINRRLLKWRTLHTLFLTATTLITYFTEWFSGWLEYVVIVMVLISLITGICMMMALFALRKII